ncbi:MAG TPA: hypothetical protein VM509_15870, partial [Planctomycetota bacterium]|nr:hypothetical protein [Planctomycetota bacterium]
MKTRIWMPLVGVVGLAACAPREKTPDEMVLLDETVPLTRESGLDVATRVLAVDSDAFIVAILDEDLTDVRVTLASTGAKKDADALVQVENNMAGAGTEIATLEASEDSQVTLTLESHHDATQPGKVHVRVLRLRKGVDGAPYAARLTGYRAWAESTRSRIRFNEFESKGMAAVERAVASFAGPEGDASLHAQAQLLQAHDLRFFQIDFGKARAAAQAARQSFANLPTPDPLGVARAQFAEARALYGLSTQRTPENTSAQGAEGLARELLIRLTASDSALGPIERARALSVLADLDINASALDDADKRYANAGAIYHDVGWLAGEREIRGSQGLALLERGRWKDAAETFLALLPEVDLITDPDLRVQVYLGAARAQSLSGQPDASLETLLVALKLTRDYHLRVREASALQSLGETYENRGDLLQMRTYFVEALRIMREQNDVAGYVWGLAGAGIAARNDGDYARAIALHEEAVERAFNPIARIRTLRELGQDYYSQRDYPKAIEQFRESLATKMQDPKHHAFSDVKRNLALSLIEVGDPATFGEASRLIDENLESSLKVGDKLGVIGAHRTRASLYAAQGKTDRALAEYVQTFALCKELREKSANNDARSTTLAHETAALRGYLDAALHDVPTGSPRSASAREEAALYTLERARDTYFGSARTGDLDSATAARVDALLERMADMSVKIASLLHAGAAQGQSTELATLQTDMSNLHSELDQLRTAADVKRRAAGHTDASALALRPLAPGAVQISYALGYRSAYVWARSARGIQVARLAKPPRELEQELIALGALDRQTQPAAVELALTNVSADLLPRGLLPKDSTSLEIVSEGRIAAVPFAGLISPESPEQRLIETHAITMITSMYAVEEPPRPRQARPFRLVALASGTSGLRSVPVVNPVAKLQAASSEARTVADLFTAKDPRATVRLMVAPEGS